jgi:hypothetical protein
MSIPRPPRGFGWFFSQTATYDILIAIFASVIGFSAAVNYAAHGHGQVALLTGLATIEPSRIQLASDRVRASRTRSSVAGSAISRRRRARRRVIIRTWALF